VPPDTTSRTPDADAEVRQKLRSAKMTLDLKEVALRDVLVMLRTTIGEQVVLTPAATRAGLADMTVTLKVDALEAGKVLDLVVQSLPARWDVREGVIYVRDHNGR
jgi:hypothetical protein